MGMAFLILAPLRKCEFVESSWGFLFLLAVLAVMCAGVYLGVIFWLLAWKFFATHEQVMAIAKSGPLTRFDRWIIRVFGPPPTTLKD